MNQCARKNGGISVRPMTVLHYENLTILVYKVIQYISKFIHALELTNEENGWNFVAGKSAPNFTN